MLLRPSLLSLLSLLALLPLAAHQPVPGPFGPRPEVQAFIQEEVRTQGFEAGRLQALFATLEPLPRVLELAAPTEPRPKDWEAHRRNVLNPKVIRLGRAFRKAHARFLARQERLTGVPRAVLLGILGVETHFGRGKGRFPMLQSLATLAFDLPPGPRQAERTAFFRGELEAFLLWCRETGQDPQVPKGSFAGAYGIPQFMPSSIRAYGVDGDGDGQVDLDDSDEDALASIARFLVKHGWKAGQPVMWELPGDEATREKAAAKADGTPHPSHRLADLLALGLKPVAPSAQVKARAQEAVILVDLPTPGAPTRYALGFPNFYAITRYNRSFFYATSVVDLGRAIEGQLKVPAARPTSGKAKHRRHGRRR